MTPYDVRLPLIAAEARVKTCHVYHQWCAMREAGAKFHPLAFSQFTGLELRHIQAITDALEAHDAMPTKRAKTSLVAHRLPEDWTPPDEWIEWASRERRWQPEDTREEAEIFANYWQAKSGQQATKLDWRKTWANWVRNSRRANGDYVPVTGKVSTESRAKFLRDKMALYTRMGRESELEPMRKELAGLEGNVLPFERKAG